MCPRFGCEVFRVDIKVQIVKSLKSLHICVPKLNLMHLGFRIQGVSVLISLRTLNDRPCLSIYEPEVFWILCSGCVLYELIEGIFLKVLV